jgi:hypothetical protein
MNQKTIFLFFAFLSAMLFSCTKETEQTKPIPSIDYPNYSQLKVGNYWIYEQFGIDTLGNALSKNTFDSCYIEKDTIINRRTFFKVVKPRPYATNQIDISFQRDSLHYVVNSFGKILFSSQDFTTIFESSYITAGPVDTVCQVKKQMADNNLSVTTPAGAFTTSNAKVVYSMFPNWTFAGSSRNKHTRYAENIGIVIETLPFFASNPNYVERRLVRYHLN